MKTIVTCSILLMFAVCSRYRAVDAGKILIYPFGHCLNSHLLVAEKMSAVLAKDGNEVDMIVSTSYDSFEHHRDPMRRVQSASSMQMEHIFSHGERRAGVVHLVEFETPADYNPICNMDSIQFMLDATMSQRFDGLFHTFVRYCDSLLADTQLMHSLKTASYDLLIIESIDPCGRILADYLDIPFILFVTTGLGHFDTNPRPPSYLPAAIAPFTSDMNFGQRIVNVIIKVMYDVIVPSFVGFNQPFEMLKVKYGFNTSLSLMDTANRAALRFVNSDFTVDYPAPIEPDNILIGGFGVNKNPPPLSPDLERFIEGSGDAGIIVVSFGTLVRRYGQHISRIFFEAFSRLPQRVIWRHYGNEDLMSADGNSTNVFDTDSISNIRLMRWLPQNSLLAHPKTRLFVSHCGLNSVLESAHFGVPILAIPLSMDQLHHAAKVSGPRLGMAITVDIRTMTVESLYADLRRMLTDNSYRENAARMSELMNDQPSTPSDRIRFWVDYVVRHGGIHHLRSDVSRRLTWIQYWSLDVVALLVSVGLTVVYVAFRLLGVAARLAGGVASRVIGKLKVD